MDLRTTLNINEANIGTAILQNYERAQEILETSQNSEGSALRENEVYLNSIQGHIDQLIAKWQTFSVALADSSGFKAIIDGIGGVANVLTGLINAFGPGTMLATPLMAMLSKTSNSGKVLNMPSYGVNRRMWAA